MEYHNFKELNNAIKSCDKCSLCDNKNNKVVIGRGVNVKIPIKILIVGEASGYEEAKQGLPFVGNSGKMLNNWLKLFNTDNYVIVNVVKNRPIGENGKDRQPTEEEIKACSPFLFNQIKLFKPNIILCLGNIAFKTLINTSDNITSVVNKKTEYEFNGIRTLVYFHPSYILRNLKEINWQKDIEELASRLTGTKVESASKLWSTSGVKNFMLNKELEELNKVDDKLSYPLIGMRTEFSLMSYGGKFEEQQKYLLSHGVKSVVVCDDNTTSSFFKISKLKDFGVKIIYGANIISGDIFISLIAENFKGYKHMNRIISEVNMSKFATIDNITAIIRSVGTEGLRLIIPSSYFHVNVDYTALIKLFNISYIGFVEDSLSAKIRANYAKNLYNLPMVIFLDNKYSAKEDYDVFLTIRAIKNHKKYKDMKVLDKNTYSYIKLNDELIADEETIKNSQQLIDGINFDIPEYHNLLPEIDKSSREEKEKKFKELVMSFDLSNSIKRYAKKKNISLEESKETYNERIERELQLINSKEFIDYFMIVRDVHTFVKESNKTLPAGRGSVGGSLVAYCLGVTQVDPLCNNLIFERFINEDRIDLPDIDCDFQSSFRPEIIKYLINKYGDNKVIQSCTLLSFKETSAISEVGKAWDIPPYVINDIKNMLVKRTSGDARSGNIISQSADIFPEFKKYLEKYSDFFKVVEKIEGQHKAVGTHASGIMLFKDEYYNYVSLMNSNKGMVTSFEYPEMEHNGLVKLDILGLSALDLIDEITKKHNINVNYEINHDDEKVYELIRNKYTQGVFQLSTQAMIRVGTEVVYNFTDIIAVNGFVRPAPIRYGVPEKYKKFKKNGEMFSIGSKTADEMLKGYGFEEFGNLILFQEQIMVIFNKIAGFYSVHSNSAVKAISKSKGITTFFEQYGQKFIDGALKNGFKEEEAKEIFNNIFQMGSYAYNISHCTLYAHEIFYTAWLKTYYPEEFYEVAYNLANKDEKNGIISEMIMRGYKFSLPNINKSDAVRMVYKDGIFYSPLSDIKSLSVIKAKQVIEGRPYKDLEDLFGKIKFTDRMKEIIKKSCIESNNTEELLKTSLNLPMLISNKDNLSKYISEKYNIKLQTIKEINEAKIREGWYICILEGSIKFSSIGDWLPLTEKPTDEEIQTNPKYSSIKKWGWMSKWAKFPVKDTEGTDGFIKLNPDLFLKFAENIRVLKKGNLLIIKVRVAKNINDKQTLLDMLVF